MQSLETSDYRGYQWPGSSHIDEEDSYPLYVEEIMTRRQRSDSWSSLQPPRHEGPVPLWICHQRREHARRRHIQKSERRRSPQGGCCAQPGQRRCDTTIDFSPGGRCPSFLTAYIFLTERTCVVLMMFVITLFYLYTLCSVLIQ